MNQKVIAIIDYGMGNIKSISRALDALGCAAIITSDKNKIEGADGYILPGVGAFPQAIENLSQNGLMECINTQVLELEKPILGICLGMHLMAIDSAEQKLTKGFGWIDAHVRPLKTSKHRHVPHVGWNNNKIQNTGQIFNKIDLDSHFYFDHSFEFLPRDKSIILSTCSYGENIVSAVRQHHIFATQFHPEKSQLKGLKLLRNFLDFVSEN
jgi:imidazole glycerol-phosphate synthase subunit HisH